MGSQALKHQPESNVPRHQIKETLTPSAHISRARVQVTAEFYNFSAPCTYERGEPIRGVVEGMHPPPKFSLVKNI